MNARQDADPAGSGSDIRVRGAIVVREAGIIGQRGPVLEIYAEDTLQRASIEVPDVPENAAIVKALRTLGAILDHTADENTTLSP